MSEFNRSIDNKTPKVVGALVIGAVVLIAIFTMVLKNDPKTNSGSVSTVTPSSLVEEVTTTPVADSTATDTTTTPPAASDATPVADTTTTTNTYKDGTYKVTTNYTVPEGGGDNQLTTSLTIKDDTITAVTASVTYGDRESEEYTDGFKNNISGAIVGKKIDSASVGRVGGASLTSASFNDALDAIASQAKA